MPDQNPEPGLGHQYPCLDFGIRSAVSCCPGDSCAFGYLDEVHAPGRFTGFARCCVSRCILSNVVGVQEGLALRA